MDKEYSKSIIEAGVKKLTVANKQLSEIELVRGIVHYLKEKLGKDDTRHSAKGRFRRDSFKYIIGTEDWKQSIALLENKKYVLAKDYEIQSDLLKTNTEWNWRDVNKGIAQKNILSILHKVDPFKFEVLVKDLVKKKYPDVVFDVTVKTGDGGIDIFGTKPDPTQKDKEEVICIQVKNFKKTVGRPEADRFIGAVQRIINDKNKNYSKFIGLFITSGKYPKSFNDTLQESCTTGCSFSSWDGDELIEQMLFYGMGVKYSIDLDFWENVDSAIIPRQKINSEE